MLELQSVVPIHWYVLRRISVVPGRPAWLDRPGVAFSAAMTTINPSSHVISLAPGRYGADLCAVARNATQVVATESVMMSHHRDSRRDATSGTERRG